MSNGDDKWALLINQAIEQQADEPHVATQYDSFINTASKPHKLVCDDGSRYAVKFINNPHGDGKAIATEQIVALAGALIDAPVPRVDLIQVSDDLVNIIKSTFFDSPASAGIHHGSKWVDGYSGPLGLTYQDLNRDKFAALDVLYTWLLAGDHQWIYRNTRPNDVLSVDHSAFFPGGPNWQSYGLLGACTGVTPDPHLAALNLTDADRATTLERLLAVTDNDIASLAPRARKEWVSWSAQVRKR
ncbi:MAG: hypothetical protein WAV20_16060 [Blastocatellia bacterium]